MKTLHNKTYEMAVNAVPRGKFIAINNTLNRWISN